MKSSDPLKLFETIGKQAKLVVVSKGHPWSACIPFYEAGCRDFGESRLQEALPKIQEAPRDIRWHFIGVLQKNKVAKVVQNFALIHSVDSYELAEKISKESIGRKAHILLQVNIEHRHGFTPSALRESFAALKALPNLAIDGLMTMAPLTDDTASIRRTFRTVRELGLELGLKELSMGMSHDWPLALEEGATILRIGSLFFS